MTPKTLAINTPSRSSLLILAGCGGVGAGYLGGPGWVPCGDRGSGGSGDVRATVIRKKRELPPVPSPVTGEVEARLIAMACSKPPEGYARWSLRLLEKHVALAADIPSLDHSTSGRVLEKRNCVLI